MRVFFTLLQPGSNSGSPPPAARAGPASNQPHWLTTAHLFSFPVRPVVDAATAALRHPGLLPGRDLLVLAARPAGCIMR